MQTKTHLLGLVFAAALLSACGDHKGSAPAAEPAAPPPASSAANPSQPDSIQNSDPKTAAPAPGAGEGASAATDPSQKK